ncbi:MAG: hypothetical protein KJO29_07965, partial [Bacteroidia bacterium]|nr:hypothetical protein [Bacteroidia bacterium]
RIARYPPQAYTQAELSGFNSTSSIFYAAINMPSLIIHEYFIDSSIPFYRENLISFGGYRIVNPGFSKSNPGKQMRNHIWMTGIMV